MQAERAEGQNGVDYRLFHLNYPRRGTGWLRKAAELGNAGAQITLGVMYDEGQGVAQDYAEAVRWYRKAAGQGNASVQRRLGAMYDQGQGVAQDYAEAVRWYRKAAEKGNAFAQYLLGVMYHQGKGVPQDYEVRPKTAEMDSLLAQANQLFSSAASLRSSQSCLISRPKPSRSG